MVSNPHISQIHNNYLHSLSTLIPYAERQIGTLDDVARFTDVMADLVQTHSNTIPILARGFLESRNYISATEVTRFLDQHLRARIGTRLIAEQYIALHYSSYPDAAHPDRPAEKHDSSYIGIIDTALHPATIIRRCESFVSEICELKYGVRPSVVISGDPETTFAHIPVHLEYIITELLKNAFRATIESGHEREPVEITIAPAPRADESQTGEDGYHGDLTSPKVLSDLNPSTAPGITLRIRDRGGGINPTDYEKLWTYGFTTFSEEQVSDLNGSTPSLDNSNSAFSAITSAGAGQSSIAGLGYGLPLGRAYAEYFGGSVAVQSLWGWGTDVYLRLKGVGGWTDELRGNSTTCQIHFSLGSRRSDHEARSDKE